eukprot:541996-Rhodomonas_salina.1
MPATTEQLDSSVHAASAAHVRRLQNPGRLGHCHAASQVRSPLSIREDATELDGTWQSHCAAPEVMIAGQRRLCEQHERLLMARVSAALWRLLFAARHQTQSANATST